MTWIWALPHLGMAPDDEVFVLCLGGPCCACVSRPFSNASFGDGGGKAGILVCRQCCMFYRGWSSFCRRRSQDCGSREEDACALGHWWGLTFDMSGGRRQAQPAEGRPLDGAVRRRR